MQVNQIYYAAFSAALMAGAKPEIAQQIAYQLTYLANDSSSIPTEDDTLPFSNQCTWQSESPDTHTSRIPINPLSHVDWLHGGKLNGRGMKLSYHEYIDNRHIILPQAKEINPINKRWCYGKNKIIQKLNRAILVAMMDTDETAQSKFTTALFCYIKKQASLNTQYFTSTTYWLILHAIRCYLFGSTFHWRPDYPANMKNYQQKKPMYLTITRLFECLNNKSTDLEMNNVLCEHLQCFSVNQRLKCFTLGLAFRKDLIDKSEAAYYTYDAQLHFSDIDNALIWMSESN